MVDVGDRDMVLGVLAVQLGFARREALTDAVQAWSQDRKRSLADIVVERQVVTAHQRQLLEPLAEEHLACHGNDSSLSIERLGGRELMHTVLETLGVEGEDTVDGAELAATIAPVAPDETAAQTDGPAAEPVNVRTGQLAGNRYEIEQLHATGGLGAVYRADDKELGRPVAVKEMQARHQHNPNLRARFLLEAGINARLQHPGIVPVFSLGSFTDGRPFYAMRFVEGESLDSAIRRFHKTAASKSAGQRTLELRQLLGHFVDLCNAIAYAHSQGVLHRDLKPANIMLGKFGETLLIDWGLAKSIGDNTGPAVRHTAGAQDGDSEFTRFGAVIGTPAFMSPEQARGDVDEVRPAADVYGLGATLFTLLTGRNAVAGNDITQMLQCVSEGKIESAVAVNPNVPRPLDAICRRAMALKPEDRYPSAQDLATDVERWLADEPTDAYPEPLRDRLGRAVRRHRAAVVGLGVLMLTTIVAMGIFGGVRQRQNRLLREARDTATENLAIAKAENARAEQNLADLRQTAFELQETAEGILARTPGAQDERQKMTSLLVDVCERMHLQRPEDPLLRRDLAQAYRIYGNLNRLFNKRDVALELYGKSLKLLEGLVTAFPENQLNRDRLAETLRGRSNVHKAVGDIKKTVDDLNRAGQIAGELLTENPENLGYLRTVATIRQNLADQQIELGMTDEATNNIAFAVDALVKLIKSPKPIPSDQPLMLLALNEQGEMLRRAGRLEESKEVLQQAFAEASNAIIGGTNDTRHSLARISLNLGQTLTLLPDQGDKANARIAEAIAIWEELTKSFPAIAFYQRYLAAAQTAQAELLLASGQTDEAVANLEQARKRLEPTVKLAPNMIAYRDVLVDVLTGLARAALATDRTDEAKVLYKEAIDHMEQITTQTPQSVLAQAKRQELVAELNDMK
jgi:tetratricopeptide (TPR) repeat protein